MTTMSPTAVRCIVDPKSIPNGTYYGIWIGYVVGFSASDYVRYELTLTEGIRGRTGCRVHCFDGEITVERVK